VYFSSLLTIGTTWLRQPCVNGDWLCQWEIAIFVPHRIHTPWPITKKFVASHYVGDPYGCAKFGANQSTGGFWKNGWNITKILFIYLYFFRNSPTGQTRRRIFTLDGSNDAFSRKAVRFGGFVDITPHFRGEIPPNHNFWGVNRRFKAKRAKYWKFHIIETTPSISTKFCTTIETTD